MNDKLDRPDFDVIAGKIVAPTTREELAAYVPVKL